MKKHFHFFIFGLFCVSICGCKSPEEWLVDADQKATAHIKAAQIRDNLRVEEINVENPSDTLRRRLIEAQGLTIADPLASTSSKEPISVDESSKEPIYISLEDALKIAAAESREFRSKKEDLYKSALALDLEAHNFRTTFTGLFTSRISTSRAEHSTPITGNDNRLKLGANHTFKNGTELTSSVAIDLAKMLSAEKDSAWGIIADASITIPLLRGAGRFVVEEPLIQAERDLVYNLREFEQYKRNFIVSISTTYFNVLLSNRQLRNQDENYKRAVASTRRSRRLADAGRLQEYEFDQSYQNELDARNSWVAAYSKYDSMLESFRVSLGLPPDALVFPYEAELTKLQEYTKSFAAIETEKYEAEGAIDWDKIELKKPDSKNIGPLELDEKTALAIAFENRPDLQTARDRVDDSERKLRIAADNLRTEITIGGSASTGESRSYGNAGKGNAKFKPIYGSYSALLSIDLPFERTYERNAYRNAFFTYDKAVRNYQEAEDNLKKEVYNIVRSLRETRETLTIQFMALSLAQRRVESMDILLQAGRVDMTDVLGAQQSLLAAQNSLYSAIVSYRIRELEFQSKLGVLDVTAAGTWFEFNPKEYLTSKGNNQ
ncbi:MAG: TolC family protein [Kiritimatiellae bacterium]|nr:TolC family protein [Kiritimatiellia bacterium]